MDAKGTSKPKPSKATPNKKAQDRSPRYPCIGLREGVEKARVLYANEGRAMVPREVAVKWWGYKSLHGNSLTLLAAMAQYGLIAKQKGAVAISDDAFAILEAPKGTPEKAAAIKRCAERPAIFSSTLQKHPDGLPSDDTMRWDLKQRGFTDQGANAVIQCLRETISFVQEEAGDYNGGNQNDPGDETERRGSPPVNTSEAQRPKNTTPPAIPPVIPQTGSPTLLVPLGHGNAQIFISGVKPTKKHIERLKRHLDLYQEDLEDEQEE